MIDLINKISYTGFYNWMIATVHPLIMLTAIVVITIGSTFYYTRRGLCGTLEDRTDAHLFLAIIFPVWTLFVSWVTHECFRVHGVNEGEPLVVVGAFSLCLYFLAGIAGIRWGFKEDSE